mmetsp:Transcript_143355/g.253032  ORF Transcript_143355/g.253032 Transcript_143355/m.253032 type:complete len:213 (-) Transcript_143355:971-1609(-)
MPELLRRNEAIPIHVQCAECSTDIKASLLTQLRNLSELDFNCCNRQRLRTSIVCSWWSCWVNDVPPRTSWWCRWSGGINSRLSEATIARIRRKTIRAGQFVASASSPTWPWRSAQRHPEMHAGAPQPRGHARIRSEWPTTARRGPGIVNTPCVSRVHRKSLCAEITDMCKLIGVAVQQRLQMLQPSVCISCLSLEATTLLLRTPQAQVFCAL